MVQKINQLAEKNSIILLVNRNLSCSGSEFQTDHLLFYDRKLSHLEIVKILRRNGEKLRDGEISKLKGMGISIDSTADVINLDEIARGYSVSLEALKEVIQGQSKPGYSLLGDQLVSYHVLEKIQDELTGVKKHNEAIKIFEGYGIKSHSQLLAFLGYKVKWSGLDPENAEIIKA